MMTTFSLKLYYSRWPWQAWLFSQPVIYGQHDEESLSESAEKSLCRSWTWCRYFAASEWNWEMREYVSALPCTQRDTAIANPCINPIITFLLLAQSPTATIGCSVCVVCCWLQVADHADILTPLWMMNMSWFAGLSCDGFDLYSWLRRNLRASFPQTFLHKARYFFVPWMIFYSMH